MRLYHTPWFFRKIYAAKAVWQIPSTEKILYLTFDDGPTTDVTQWILDVLNEYHAKATFFCVGENVTKHPELFSSLTAKEHAVGNHTFNHLNGWKTPDKTYIENIKEADKQIHSRLYRPPYGKMKKSQARLVHALGYKSILWTVLSYDFDRNLDTNEAWKQIVKHTKPGSIIVFHDHLKAFENLKELLPKTLAYFAAQGYRFDKISL